MAKAKQPESTVIVEEGLKVGDAVMWHGIPLKVYQVDESGMVHARSLTQFVSSTDPKEFQKL